MELQFQKWNHKEQPVDSNNDEPYFIYNTVVFKHHITT